MITRYINSKIIIDRIYDEYAINSDDFVTRVPNWIYNALRLIKIKQAYIIENAKLEFTDYKIHIPYNIEKIYGVTINNIYAKYSFSDKLLIKTQYNSNADGLVAYSPEIFTNVNPENLVFSIESDNSIINNDVDVFGLRTNKINFSDNIWYKIMNNWIHTNIKSGTCVIMAGSIPTEYDEELDSIFPIIPDNEDLINAIIAYCLKNILQRGYKHPILNLANKDYFTNPNLMFDRLKGAARNSCNSLSESAKLSLREIIGLNIM